MIEDSSEVASYKLQKAEVYAVTKLSVAELIKVHAVEGYKFSAQLLTNEGQTKEIEISKELFPENYDNYHYKMALLADRYFKGEESLIY